MKQMNMRLILTNFLNYFFQEYSVQITFRQTWNDDRLSYAGRLNHGDMRGKTITLFYIHPSCIGQGCSSTYIVVRLSNKRAKTTENAFLPLKWPFVGKPDNYIGWATSLAYTWVSSTYQRTIFCYFGEKMLRIGGFEKLTSFETTKFQ